MLRRRFDQGEGIFMPVFRVLLLCCLGLLAGCDKLAHWSYDLALDAERARAGLDTTEKTVGDIDWFYLASESDGDKPPVLLIHGFGADSSNWVRFANALEGEYNFIIPDLPGHGESIAEPTMNYSTEHQAQRLLALMDALGHDRFHVAGSSMGGAITLQMALQAPERVLSMGLVDAAGLDSRTEAFDKMLAEGEGNPLIARTPEQFFTTVDWAMEDPPYMPDFMIRVMGEKKAAMAPITDKVWQDINAEPSLAGRLETIQVPALILWGKKDRLLPVSDATRFNELLPNSRMVIFEGLGHLPMAEAPVKSAVPFRVFWSEVTTVARRP
jgi:abhydrolase domain-containing protein 6